MSIPIHQAFQFQGQKKQTKNSHVYNSSRQEFQVSKAQTREREEEQAPVQNDPGRYPSDASNSNYPVKIRCKKCRAVSITRMNSQLGPAAWVWCVLLSPFACLGISCLCIQSCRDKVHFCNRCGQIVGKRHADVC